MTGNADADWALHAIPRISTLPSAEPRVSPVPRAELGFAARVGVGTSGQRATAPATTDTMRSSRLTSMNLMPMPPTLGVSLTQRTSPRSSSGRFRQGMSSQTRTVSPVPSRIVRTKEEPVCAHIGNHPLDDQAVADVLGRDLAPSCGRIASTLLRFSGYGSMDRESPAGSSRRSTVSAVVSTSVKSTLPLFACVGQFLDSAMSHKRSKRHSRWRPHAKDFFLTKVATRATTPARPSGRSFSQHFSPIRAHSSIGRAADF